VRISIYLLTCGRKIEELAIVQDGELVRVNDLVLDDEDPGQSPLHRRQVSPLFVKRRIRISPTFMPA